jgi:hypothetical protein
VPVSLTNCPPLGRAGIKDECLRVATQLNQLHKQVDEAGMKAYGSIY